MHLACQTRSLPCGPQCVGPDRPPNDGRNRVFAEKNPSAWLTFVARLLMQAVVAG
jgi:hypothetical protein